MIIPIFRFPWWNPSPFKTRHPIPVYVPAAHLAEVCFVPAHPGGLVDLVEPGPQGEGHQEGEDQPFRVQLLFPRFEAVKANIKCLPKESTTQCLSLMVPSHPFNEKVAKFEFVFEFYNLQMPRMIHCFCVLKQFFNKVFFCKFYIFTKPYFTLYYVFNKCNNNIIVIKSLIELSGKCIND